MSTKSKIFIIVAVSLFFVGIIAFESFYVLAPKRKADQVREMVHSDSTYMKKYSSYLEHKELFPLIKEIAYLEAQLETAQSDSIWLLVNVPEKSASIKIKSVEMHKSDVGKMKVDPFFYALDPVTYRKIFSEPLVVRAQTSTVLKNPIVVKKAPKDTIEAMAQLTLPDSIRYNPAFVTLELDYGIRLVLKQAEKDSPEDKEARDAFDKAYKKLQIENNIKSLYRKDYVYVPEIILELPKVEIHSIYRAIPEKASIVFSF
jgi:hypothetical protein